MDFELYKKESHFIVEHLMKKRGLSSVDAISLLSVTINSLLKANISAGALPHENVSPALQAVIKAITNDLATVVTDDTASTPSSTTKH